MEWNGRELSKHHEIIKNSRFSIYAVVSCHYFGGRFVDAKNAENAILHFDKNVNMSRAAANK